MLLCSFAAEPLLFLQQPLVPFGLLHSTTIHETKKNSAVWRTWCSHLSMPLKTMTPTRLKAPSPITNACSTLLALLQNKTFFLKCATKWGYWNLTKATNWQEACFWRAMVRLTMCMSQDILPELLLLCKYWYDKTTSPNFSIHYKWMWSILPVRDQAYEWVPEVPLAFRKVYIW